MKKISIFLILMFCMFIFSNSVQAASLKMLVETLDDISTKHAPKTLTVRVMENYELETGEVIPEGVTLYGDIIKVSKAKRGKQNAYFYYQVKTYCAPGAFSHSVKRENLIAKGINYTPL